MERLAWAVPAARWFEVRLVGEDGPGAGAGQLVRAARGEGHRAQVGQDEEGVEVALVLVRAENVTGELERLMIQCGLSGCYRSLGVYPFGPDTR